MSDEENGGGELPEGDWEAVAEVGQRYKADLMAGSLQAAGIDARVVDKSFRQEPLPSVRSFAIVRVYVPAESAEMAKRLLEEAGASADESGDEGS
jgi:hypothetical protein